MMASGKVFRPAVLALAALASAVAAPVSGVRCALAQERVLPRSQQELQLSYAPLVKQTAPAVVNIFAKKIVRQRVVNPMMEDPFFRRFFGENFNFGVPRERVENALGSGVIVDASGVVVTNNHVIGEADEITVVLSDRREFSAKVLTKDERTDLAVLRIEVRQGGAPEALPFLRFADSDELQVGDVVLAIGNPFGVGQTVTSGIVSALARTTVGITDYSFFIQTDAAINPGNSGGALVGVDGRLAGINTAIYSRSGGSNGIGFAIPSNMVRTVVAAAMGGKAVVRPWVGLGGQPVTNEIAQSLGLARPQGVLVNEIYPGGPAERAGIKAGDVVTAVDGREVNDPASLRYRLGTRPVGADARLDVLRRGQPLALAVKLVAPPEAPPRQLTRVAGENPLAGATIANLSPALAEELQLDAMRRGVIVIAIERGGVAARLGIQPGDIVAQIGDQPVPDVAALVRLVRDARPQWRLAIQRGDRLLQFNIRG